MIHDDAAFDATGETSRPVLRMHKDETGVIRHIDGPSAHFLGWQPAEMVGHRSLEFIHPEDHDAALVSWVRLLAKPADPQCLRVRHRNATEQWLWFDVTNHNHLDDPGHHIVLTEMVPVVEDIPPQASDWVSSQLLRRLTEALPVGVLQIDRERRILFHNERLDAIVGRSAAGSVDEEFDGVGPAGREALDQALDAVMAGMDSDVEVAFSHPELGPRRCDIRLRALIDDTGTAVNGALLCVIDVTEEARRREEIERRATYDALTQCLNREAIVARLADTLAGSAADEGVAVIFIDLDRFKPINDAYGHAAGDHLLQEIAGRLRGGARDMDLVGRIGGDEFLIVCPMVESAADALRIGRRVAAAVRLPADLATVTLIPSCSIGVAWSRDRDEDAKGLLARADSAMYESKRDGLGEPVLAPA